MLDFSQYTPPGVYVDAGSTPTVSLPGVAPSVICLIGEGVGYHTHTETVSFEGSATSVVLTKRGINVNSIVVTGFVTDPSVAGQSIPKVFEKDIAGSPGTPKDYSTTVDSTGGAANSVTTLIKTTGGKIETTYPRITVSYRYTDADYYGLHRFNDFTSFQAAYGPAVNATDGAVVSPLSFAAQIALANGANEIWAIALSGVGTPQVQFAEAYNLLSNSNNSANINVVVPLWNGVSDGVVLGGMIQTLNAALLADANNAVLRMAIVGLDRDYAGSTSQLATLAQQSPSSRIVLPWPNKFNVYNGYTSSMSVVDGFYMAAALGAQLTSRAPQEPLTKKYPQGFAGLPTTVQQALRKTDKDTLAAAGVCVVETDRNGRLQVRHGLTTNYAGGVLAREISIVRSQDTLYGMIQDALDTASLSGSPITSTTSLQVKSIVAGGLESAKNSNLIFDYHSLAVREQSPPGGDPTVIEVKFAYKPTWPLNYILVSFAVDTTTGESTLTTNPTPITG